jgi:hypothetical protein
MPLALSWPAPAGKNRSAAAKTLRTGNLVPSSPSIEARLAGPDLHGVSFS